MKRERPEDTRGQIEKYQSLDRETIDRFKRAYLAKPTLLTMDMPREMGYDYQIVDVQRIIDIAEEKGLLDKLYSLMEADSPTELMEKLMNLPKTGPVGNTLGGAALKVGITLEDLMDQTSKIHAFFKSIDTPEGHDKLKEALTKLGY
ncbi:hypothetical protein IH979_01610 [Patescibacteria group bacterium]|nr:hypothetical protein [Patescibacteria group bacterium]